MEESREFLIERLPGQGKFEMLIRYLKVWIFLFTICYITGCTKKEFKYPNLVDSYILSNRMKVNSWKETVEYNFLYIGQNANSILLDQTLRFMMPVDSSRTIVDSDYYIDWDADKYYKRSKEGEITIQVDTSLLINKSDASFNPKSSLYQAYPVYLINNDIDTLSVGYGDIIPVYLEALDSTNNWLPIEREFFYFCGNDVGAIILPPNQIAITSVFRYKGDYKTKLRLKTGKNYSNSYWGYINYQQFESKRYQ